MYTWQESIDNEADKGRRSSAERSIVSQGRERWLWLSIVRGAYSVG